MTPLVFSGFLFLLGSLAALAFGGRPVLARRLSCGLAASACLILLLESSACLFYGYSFSLSLSGPPVLGGFRFSLPPLSAFFTALIAGVGLVSSLYALDYAEEYDEQAAALGFFYNLFLLGMSFLPAAQNVFSFLFCWEAMTLASFFLVILDHANPDSRSAGYLYFVMSQAGTALLLAMFFLLHREAGAWDFEAFRSAGPQLAPGLKNALFLLALAGFGTKAGIVPLHLWLPAAHPAAPSHVSALMSGVMIKTAIYGLILTVFSFLGGGPWWWGALVLAAASVSSVLGVLYALMERDLKRLLAYSSVENIGIVLMGIGAGMLFHSFGRMDLSALALSAGLYHVLNHAVFKSLLFLSAGAVVKSVRTRNMEEMGGLIKTMPVTALCFLTGSLAVSALPPLNGFVSEWLTFQTLLAGLSLPVMPVRVLTLFVAAALALTGGLVAACFVKAFGITFLALPRSESARQAKEAFVYERLAMGLLALACAALGLFPGRVLAFLQPVIGSLDSGPAGPANALSGPYGGVLPQALLALIALGAAAAWSLARVVGGPARVRYSPTWGCGLEGLTPRMEYTATAFAKPFRMLFEFLYRPLREVRQECVAGPYFPKSIHYSSEIRHVIQEKLYRPPLKLLLAVSHLFRRLQAGSVNLYLAYLSAAVTALLLLTVWRSR